MRFYCLEHGVPIRQGAGVFKIDILRVIYDDTNDLTARSHQILRDLHDDFVKLEQRIASVSKDIKDIADADERARPLITIPGIGAPGATAIVAAIGDTSRFKRARDVAAWLG
jgi:transposase